MRKTVGTFLMIAGIGLSSVTAAWADDMMPELDPALVAEGEDVFRRCKACHQIGEGAQNRTGPQLNGVVGRVIGSDADFRYSPVFVAANEAGEVWEPENLAAFLQDPRGEMKGTRMAFAGLRTPEETAAVIEYMRSFPSEPEAE